IPYGIHPDVTGAGCAGGCGTGTALQNITSVHSHELVEAVTDTQVAQATTFGPPLAWYDQNCGEIGDICNANEAPITINGRTWTVQQQWSNAAGTCITTRTTSPICTYPNVPPTCRICTCADNGVNCTGATPVCETDATNIKKGDCVECVS